MRYLVAVLIKGGLATSQFCGEKTTKVQNVPDGQRKAKTFVVSLV